MMPVIKMKIVSILISVLGMLLTASSWGQATICEPCHTEELRRAAINKVLASIACDSVNCGKTIINFFHYVAISKWSLTLNIHVIPLVVYKVYAARIGSKEPSSLLC